jgi:hypothetical protein
MRYEMQQMEAAGLVIRKRLNSYLNRLQNLESGIERTQTRVHALASETAKY